MIEAVGRALDRRLGMARFVREAMNHVFPDHWSFMIGEIALYAFAILVITGIYLALFFNASDAEVVYHGSYHALDGLRMSAAYESSLHLSFGVPAGLLIRQMHHWAADIFIAAIVAHLARIFFTAAYRRPRELNWLIGLTLLVLAVGNGFFGYSLLGDLLSGAGLRVGYAILLSIPVAGPWLAFLVFGGTVPANGMTPHMYAMHVVVIPALISLLLGIHLAIIWRQRHTNYPGPGRTNRTIVGSRLWPSYAAKSLGLFFLVFGVIAMMGGLFQIDPVWIYGPYNPVAIIPGAQPDWYLGWVEGAIRLFPGVNLHLGHWLVPELFFPGLLFPALVFLALYLWPFFAETLSLDDRQHHVLLLPWQQPFNTAFGCAVFMFLLVLLVAGADDFIAVMTDSSVVTLRTLLRILVFVIPALTFVVVYWLCLRRRARHAQDKVADEAQSTVPQERPQAGEGPSLGFTVRVRPD
ncbi:MAG TPA: ubiquinol-cytochrome c reductase cytochrome b subunit [Acidobacteriaceae bacterium]|nr:ubiquinol-cytochrome c reductase cytochrome b subunit [Acidobacteriaceae bacterium]